MRVKIILPFIWTAALLFSGCQTPDKQNFGEQKLTPINFNKVNLEDTFWKTRLDIQAETLVPYALDKTQRAVDNLEKRIDGIIDIIASAQKDDGYLSTCR